MTYYGSLPRAVLSMYQAASGYDAPMMWRCGAQFESLCASAIFTTTNLPVLSVECWHVWQPAGGVRPWLVEWIGMIWPVHWRPASHRSCPWPVGLRSTRGGDVFSFYLPWIVMQSCTNMFRAFLYRNCESREYSNAIGRTMNCSSTMWHSTENMCICALR